MASSSADCVLGVVRLISSASRKLREDRPRLELEGLRVRVVNGDAQHVAGQHVAGELQAVKAAGDRARQRLRQRGLAHAGHVFDEQMAARQQADQRKANHFRLAANRRAERRLERSQFRECDGRGEFDRRGFHDFPLRH